MNPPAWDGASHWVVLEDREEGVSVDIEVRPEGLVILGWDSDDGTQVELKSITVAEWGEFVAAVNRAIVEVEAVALTEALRGDCWDG